MQVKKQQLELDVKQQTDSKSGKESISFQYTIFNIQGCILSPCLFNFYNIMRNAGLDEAQDGIKMAGKNINNLRYADDTILMAESEEELKCLLMKVKEENGKLA